MKKNVFLSVLVGGSLGFLLAHRIPFLKEKISMKNVQGYPEVCSVADACALFPKTSQEIIERVQKAQTKAQGYIDAISACAAENYSKETILRSYDRAVSVVGVEMNALSVLKSVHPDQAMIETAEAQYLKLNEFILEHIDGNKQIYEVFKAYAQGLALKENLSNDDCYFLKSVIEDFELQGLNLPDKERAQVLILKKQCAELETEFQRNTDQDATVIKVSEDALAAVPEDFKKTLQRDGDLYVLSMDYPVQSMIMNYCSVEETRKQYSKAFKNKAYPQNLVVLEALVKKRHELALLLGFESYAAYDVSNQMIKTPERAWEFENDLQKKALAVAEKDFNQLVSDLPEGISLTKEGKLESWNSGFVSTYFKKKYYSIDEQVFSEYFPMEKTVAGLIGIYEKFFNLSIESVPARSDNGSMSGIAQGYALASGGGELATTEMWHPDVRLLCVKNKEDGKIIGYIFLDMFPRDKKYGHAAAFEGVFALKKDDGTRTAACVTLVCNFTKPMGDKPSLLKYGEVTTFFHEFGHAIHCILGATKYWSLSGFNTEVDFVELPSQMLENWMEDKEILALISSHYKTGLSLPKELIEKRLELLKFGQGLMVVNQLALGMSALEIFGPQQAASPDVLFKKFSEQNNRHFTYEDETHRICSFGHIASPLYGPKYYGYLWSLVLAEDVFEQIEKEGLLNPAAGKKYADAILSRGGSKDANDMLRDYLGREPRFDAFYKKMGLE